MDPSRYLPQFLLRFLDRFLSREVTMFLAVGGVGFVVDVAAFNVLRSQPLLAGLDPSYARVGAVALAMVVTYVGNRLVTWRDSSHSDRRREVALFVAFNVVGMAFSVVSLVVSHDLLGLTSRIADNVSANVVGLALGTLFRFWSYRRFVFAPPPAPTPTPLRTAVAGSPVDELEPIAA